MGEEDCVIPDDSIYVMWEITGIILWIQENLEQ